MQTPRIASIWAIPELPAMSVAVASMTFGPAFNGQSAAKTDPVTATVWPHTNTTSIEDPSATVPVISIGDLSTTVWSRGELIPTTGPVLSMLKPTDTDMTFPAISIAVPDTIWSAPSVSRETIP